MSVIDALAGFHHPFGIDFTGGKGRCHAVGQEQQGIYGIFVHAARAEKVHGIVRMKIEETGQNVLVIRQIHYAGIAEIAPHEIGIDFKEFAIANDKASIAADAVMDGIENPAASQDYVARLERIAELSEQYG